MATALTDVVRSQPLERRQSSELTPTWRWWVLVVGAMSLAAGPAVPRVLDAFNLSGSAGWIIAIYFGFGMAAAIAPSLALAICATLSWRPAWQRVLLFAPALAIQLGSHVAFGCKGTPSDRELTAVLLAPLMIMAAASPAFLLRLWRQWVLVPAGNPARPKPASIVSFLLATTCWAAAAACTQWISRDCGGLLSDPGLQDEPGLEAIAKLFAAVIYLMIPGGFMGLALAFQLRAALVRSRCRAWIASSTVAIATLVSAVGSAIALVRLTFQTNNGPPSTSDLLGAALGVGSFCLTMLAIGLASFFTLRLLGYRLIHRGSSPEPR